MTDHQRLRKIEANAVYADKFPRRKRKDRRKARKARVARREAEWLRLSGLERDKRWPLA